MPSDESDWLRRIERARIAAGLSRAEACRRAGVRPQHWGRYVNPEDPEHRRPGADLFQRMAQAVGLDLRPAE
ncbi:MAG: helix-turn-helix transcriptional regulator [Planctomycetota bacterium]